MAQGIAAVGVGLVGIPAVMPGLAMPGVGVGGRDVGVRDMVMGGVDVPRRLFGTRTMRCQVMRRMPGRAVVSRYVRVGADGAGEGERERRHGCNQPCRPCLAPTAH